MQVKSLRVHRRVWLGFHKSIVLLVCGNHTSSRFNIFRGSTKRHALVRALVVASFLSVIPLMEIMPETGLEKNHVVDLSDLCQILFDNLVEPFWGVRNVPGSGHFRYCCTPETGAICYVDELFLHCLNKPDCMNILQSLRSRGVLVHQWWGD